ncbi:MAG: bifunctional folylpolyglutamate synthase/dihydrofolate synthase [Planctomycetaceae bacterium]|nr:bifunctional folylpolyglutamate synthase/dihydrofolate synthase [Planctomycetaceae bacterium]
MKDIVKAWNNALTFLYDRIDYERNDRPQRVQSFKLNRMHELMRRLGNPQQHLRIIHVAGTKGKGSTAHMTASVLKAAGLRCGLYTSPHLETLEERFVVDGAACQPAELVELVDLVRPVVKEMDQLAGTTGQHVGRLTFFEITTAIAFLYFHQQKVDLAIIEVGLGGRLDSTNVCQPCVSVITSISYDHVHLLGNTLRLIATEKAGIIKPGVPVVSGVQQEEPRATIQEIAQQRGSPLWSIQDHFSAREPDANQESFDCLVQVGSQKKTWQQLQLGLHGKHQRNNAAVALAVVACLQQQGWNIPDEAVYRGLADVHCPARIEILAKNPVVLIDTAHNPASVDSLVQYLEARPKAARNILVFATSCDKDVRGMLQLLLPAFDSVILTRYVTNPRALAVEVLERECQTVLANSENRELEQPIPFIESCGDPAAAWERVAMLSGPQDLICVTGSFYLAGEMRKLVAGTPASRIVS